MNDADALLYARGLIRQYREGARPYAEHRALQFAECGDPAAAEAWRRVVAEIVREAIRESVD